MVNETGDPQGGESLGDDFWAFSLRLYARPGAPERCLALQDEGGLDVNLVLFCLWAGLTRGAPAEAVWPAILRLSELWAEAAVRPLRRIRRALKTALSPEEKALLDSATLREEVKRLELAAEERQQRALAGFAARPASPPGVAAAERAFADYLAARDERPPALNLLEGLWPPLLAAAQAPLGEKSAPPPLAPGEENPK